MEVDVHGQDSFLNQVNLFLKKKNNTIFYLDNIYIYIILCSKDCRICQTKIEPEFSFIVII